MHDGSAPTLEAAIRAHGGQAAKVRDAYQELPRTERAALLKFLRSLKAPDIPAPARGTEVAQK